MKNLFCLLFLLTLASCEPQSKFNERGDTNVARKIADIIKNGSLKSCGDTTSFYMDSLTDFKWDKLYFMYSYGSKKEIIDVIGIKWEELPDDFRIDGSAHLLIFIKNRKVTNYVGLSGLNMASWAAFVNRMSDDKKYVFTPQTAIFQFIKRCKKSKDLNGKEFDDNYIELIKKEPRHTPW